MKENTFKAREVRISYGYIWGGLLILSVGFFCFNIFPFLFYFCFSTRPFPVSCNVNLDSGTQALPSTLLLFISLLKKLFQIVYSSWIPTSNPF